MILMIRGEGRHGYFLPEVNKILPKVSNPARGAAEGRIADRGQDFVDQGQEIPCLPELRIISIIPYSSALSNNGK